jgi:phosphoribosylanthranilate isomerase
MPARVRVKVCGITNLDDAVAALEADADALGFNFYAPSPRSLSPDAAAGIAARLPEGTCTVGVFVNASRRDIERVAGRVGLTALQFHGDEDPEFCCSWPQKTIKALRVRDRSGAAAARAYTVDFILADAYVEDRFGGTGRRIALEYLEGFDRGRLILAGGLTPANVADAVHTVRPFGVDVASGIERAPGKKDWDLMKRFIAHAHAA